MNKLTNLLNSIPAKLAGLLKKKPQISTPLVMTPQVANVEVPPPTLEVEPKVSFFGKINKKEIVILVVMLLAIIILALLAVVFKIKLPIPGFEQPTPTPFVTPIPSPTPVPKYFNDADVLKIEENTNILENELNNIDIEESNIQPRPLDWTINFKK
ncbi:MAG: hypothetical protein US96_C0010G0004 [Candidatus Woesebacteria bacterium GW2011_GWB1_38_5b]|uniref:Uncharacterized protein n=1 Tax=Candidatus Woesebacteria bacterium GW2011_GWB1_38_5b TaxID=1618569 RepID=A0A0G0K720_9BACT|nr:MAG: hypothetical protein US96_C0010G0004 [Candidatus Woesebacteria bacterium GW2011_GWB1_38_5b]